MSWQIHTQSQLTAKEVDQSKTRTKSKMAAFLQAAAAGKIGQQEEESDDDDNDGDSKVVSSMCCWCHERKLVFCLLLMQAAKMEIYYCNSSFTYRGILNFVYLISYLLQMNLY